MQSPAQHPHPVPTPEYGSFLRLRQTRGRASMTEPATSQGTQRYYDQTLISVIFFMTVKPTKIIMAAQM